MVHEILCNRYIIDKFIEILFYCSFLESDKILIANSSSIIIYTMNNSEYIYIKKNLLF